MDDEAPGRGGVMSGGLCAGCGRPLSELAVWRGRRFCGRTCYHAWLRTPEGREALRVSARLGADRRRARRAYTGGRLATMEAEGPMVTMVSFRPGPVVADLEARGGKMGLTARRDLSRYYAIMEHEPVPALDADAAAVLERATAGVRFDPGNYMLLPAYVRSYLLREHPRGWSGGQTEALMKTLQDLRPAQLWALIDRLERARLTGDWVGAGLLRPPKG